MKSGVLPYRFVTSEKITIDYLRHTDTLKHVFPKHFREPSFRRCNVDRDRLVEKMLEYNRKIDAPQRVIENIELLSQPRTYVVITGQQPGLLSGPLYTIYKAVSAIVISERLSTENCTLIPVFWNASEDHDLSEIDHISMFKENEPYKIHYDCVSNTTAFSHKSLDKSEVNKMLTVVDGVSTNSEFKPLLLKKVRDIIQDSSTIGDFFSRFMISLFGEYGFAVVEPQSLRELMAPVFKRLIEQPAECAQILSDAGQELKRLGYRPKIHKESGMCDFFLLNEGGERLRVTYNNNFQADEESFSKRELLNLLNENPYRFSADAATRPITQDFIFPTYAYVAGPSEIAYLAQLKRLYDFFSLEMPVIFPRFGATIVEKKVSKALEKNHVEIRELRNKERLLKDLAKKKIDRTFDYFRNEVLSNMSEVTRQAESVDKALIGTCSLAEGRILKIINALEDKVAAQLKKYDSIVRLQITKAHSNIFPEGSLQERRINVMEYLTKFGDRFLRTVYEDFLEADYGDHRVIKC